MTEKEKNGKKKDYAETLFLPRTNFSMKASLSEKEPIILEKWKKTNLFERLRKASSARPRRILHDGPPYANGDIHIGHALNKVLKDMVVRSFQMRGHDSNYVPGWDCHGLPIEWKVEEQYRHQKRSRDSVPLSEFRQECRNFAQRWIERQSRQFERLGIMGDFTHPYTTMNFHSESRIAAEFLKCAMSGQVYRGSKPVMWSVVERTVLAEAEVEYREYESDIVWVKFPVSREHVGEDLIGSCVVIWTTTPWTLPANRAVAFSARIAYGLYETVFSENAFGVQVGEKFLLADKMAEEVAEKAGLKVKRLRSVSAEEIETINLSHPLKGFCGGYEFIVPLLQGHHVTDETGSGFVHTAPGHGREDFELWSAASARLVKRGIKTDLPFVVDDAGFLTDAAPGFGAEGEKSAARVMTDYGKKGDANERVIETLIARHHLLARGRLKHSYPHSWRSGKPVIFRNTPQWFICMDKSLADGTTLRSRALCAVEATHFVPESGKTRLHAMIAERPDWVISRQRIWGVPITLFVDESGEFLRDESVNARIIEAFDSEGADVWFDARMKERFLGKEHDHEKWNPVMDILDVWFDSGSTHAFVLEERNDLKWPADIYLEGSDQHRGWFQSSLLEGCATRGRAPFNTVITHGFTLDEQGRKMSKSLGNTISPEQITERSGADILRLWVASSNYTVDLRLGETVLQTTRDNYRKIRNTMRWMLGNLAHDKQENMACHTMPELERLLLHHLAELDASVRNYFDAFDFKNIVRVLTDFMALDLSSFYFDIRKDALYCDPPSSVRRKASLQTIRHLFRCLCIWFAPILPFTTEEAWLEYSLEADSIHMEHFPVLPEEWKDSALAHKWSLVRNVRRVVTGALELMRAEKKIGSSLEAAPVIYVTDPCVHSALEGVDLAEICITSAATLIADTPPGDAFCLEDVRHVAVVFEFAKGRKCARSWRYTLDVGMDPLFQDLSARDAAAMREISGI